MYVCACFVGIILYVLDSGSGNVLNMSALGQTEAGEGKEGRSQEEKKKIPIVGEGYPVRTTYLEVSP